MSAPNPPSAHDIMRMLAEHTRNTLQQALDELDAALEDSVSKNGLAGGVLAAQQHIDAAASYASTIIRIHRDGRT